jgi:hypothetical protein
MDTAQIHGVLPPPQRPLPGHERAIQQAPEGLRKILSVLPRWCVGRYDAMGRILLDATLSTVREADQIAVLERGRVVEQGDWATLCHRGGRFSALLYGADLKPSG